MLSSRLRGIISLALWLRGLESKLRRLRFIRLRLSRVRNTPCGSSLPSMDSFICSTALLIRGRGSSVGVAISLLCGATADQAGRYWQLAAAAVRTIPFALDLRYSRRSGRSWKTSTCDRDILGTRARQSTLAFLSSLRNILPRWDRGELGYRVRLPANRKSRLESFPHRRFSGDRVRLSRPVVTSRISSGEKWNCQARRR